MKIQACIATLRQVLVLLHLVGITACNPVLSVTPVSVWTDTTHDTYVDSGSHTTSVSDYMASTTKKQFFVNIRYENFANDGKIFDKDGNRLVTVSSFLSATRVIVFKDPLKLFIASEGSTTYKLYNMQESAALLTVVTTNSYASTMNGNRAYSIPNTNYIFIYIPARIGRFDYNIVTLFLLRLILQSRMIESRGR